jgi:uncharacterized protein
MTVEKPAWLHDRDREWSKLTEFVDPTRPGSALAIVYGRRRQGKTALLEAVAQETGAFYWQAVEQSAAQNLESFSHAWANWIVGRGNRRCTQTTVRPISSRSH